MEVPHCREAAAGSSPNDVDVVTPGNRPLTRVLFEQRCHDVNWTTFDLRLAERMKAQSSYPTGKRIRSSELSGVEPSRAGKQELRCGRTAMVDEFLNTQLQLRHELSFIDDRADG